jgi:hypothetical protein
MVHVIVALMLGGSGCQAPTSLLLSIDAPGENVASLTVGIAVNHGDLRTWPVPQGGGPPHLPGALFVLLPDIAVPVDVTLTAVDDLGRTIVRTTTQVSVPHQQVRVDLVLAADLDDGGVDGGPVDLAGAQPDLAKPAIAAIQHGLVGATATGSLTLTLPAPSAAGNLLIATLVTADAGSISAPAGWSLATEAVLGSTAHAAIFSYPNNPGGIGSVTFTILNNTIKGQLSEWSGAAASLPEQTSMATLTGASAITLSTALPTSSGEVAISCYCERLAVANPVTFTPGSGWTVLGENGTESNVIHYAADYRLGLSVGAASETESSTLSGDWAAVIATFHP